MLCTFSAHILRHYTATVAGGRHVPKYQPLAAKSKDYLLLPVCDKVCPLSGFEVEGSGGYLSARPSNPPLSTMAPSHKVCHNISLDLHLLSRDQQSS